MKNSETIKKKYTINWEMLGLSAAVVFLAGTLTGMVTVVVAMKLFLNCVA